MHEGPSLHEGPSCYGQEYLAIAAVDVCSPTTSSNLNSNHYVHIVILRVIFIMVAIVLTSDDDSSTCEHPTRSSTKRRCMSITDITSTTSDTEDGHELDECNFNESSNILQHQLRLIHLNQMATSMAPHATCAKCAIYYANGIIHYLPKLQFISIGEHGLASRIALRCEQCEMLNVIHDPAVSKKIHSIQQERRSNNPTQYNVNAQMTLAMQRIGVGMDGVQSLHSHLGLAGSSMVSSSSSSVSANASSSAVGGIGGGAGGGAGGGTEDLVLERGY